MNKSIAVESPSVQGLCPRKNDLKTVLLDYVTNWFYCKHALQTLLHLFPFGYMLKPTISAQASLLFRYRNRAVEEGRRINPFFVKTPSMLLDNSAHTLEKYFPNCAAPLSNEDCQHMGQSPEPTPTNDFFPLLFNMLTHAPGPYRSHPRPWHAYRFSKNRM